MHATLGYEESLRSSIHVGQSIRPVVHPLFVSIFVCSFVIWVPMNRCLSINQSICAYISVHPAVGLSGCRLAVFDTRFKFWCVNTLLSILLNLSYRSRALSNVRYLVNSTKHPEMVLCIRSNHCSCYAASRQPASTQKDSNGFHCGGLSTQAICLPSSYLFCLSSCVCLSFSPSTV